MKFIYKANVYKNILLSLFMPEKLDRCVADVEEKIEKGELAET